MGVEPLSTSRRSARANRSALMESGLKAVKIVSLLLCEIFPRYLQTYCPLLCLSALAGHEGSHGNLANKGLIV